MIAHTLASINKPVSKPVSAMALLAGGKPRDAKNIVPIVLPVPATLSAPKAPDADKTNLIAKNAQLQKELNEITFKYNNLLFKLRAAGMV